MEINKCKRKLKHLFDKLFQNNFQLNGYYSEKLVKCLDDCDDKGTGKILDTPFFSDLIINSLANLEDATPSIKLFITEILIIVLKNELRFSKFAQLQGFNMMAQKMCIFSGVQISWHLAVIKCVTAMTSHYTGTMWLVQHKVWTLLLNPKTQYRSIKVAQAIHSFISELVWRLNEYNEENALMEVLAYVVEPIKTSQYQHIQIIDENEAPMFEPILPSIHVLLEILRNFRTNSGPNKVVQLLGRYFIVECSLHVVLQKTRNYDLVCLLSEFSYYYILTLCKDNLSSGVQEDRDIPSELISEYYNIILCLLNKRMPFATITFAVQSVVIWAKIDSSLIPNTFERHGRTFDIENQLILLVLSPMVTYTYLVATETNNCQLLEAIEVYSIKLVKMISEHTIRIAYSFRALMETSDGKKMALQGLRELFKLKGCLNLAQAGLLYQALFYILQLHVSSDGSGALILNKNPLKTPDDVKLLSHVLEAIKMLLKEHDINWYENVEIYCLQTTLMDLLKQNFMPIKQLLQALDLIDLSIKKFLSPDMALLMESKRGSTLNEIAAIMKPYIQHEEWEVRDSALNLLLSCTEVAFVKYIPLRKLLSDNNLMLLAVFAALEDAEFYVQTTALRCLAAATKIESIWREVLTAHPNLYNQLVYLLRHNPEGIVRKEAATVLTEIYVNQKLCKNFTCYLFNVMGNAALKDLHWEVQTAALKFWRSAIKTLMSNRGMIDGKFPSVTFSKEKRKIVVLNKQEIVKQLKGMMSDLSAIGCLTVLHTCLNEEFNTEVIEQAYCVAKELVKILNYYKFHDVSDENIALGIPQIPNTQIGDNLNEDKQGIQVNVDEAMDLSSPQRDQIELREKIIDTIVNTPDYDLIVACYERLQINSHNDEDLIPSKVKNLIDPTIFLKQFKETDYATIIEDKKNWSSGPKTLDLLLDEILS